ncbi:MAG: hypothetical protein KDC53_18175 [Saprospiraceae bacterium]|nr:hypothetical protein [Saprospiraceae bacterium]
MHLRYAGLSFLILTAVFHISCSTSKRLIAKNPQVYSTDFQFEDDEVLVLLVELYPERALLKRARLVDGAFKPVIEPLNQKEAVRIQYLDDQDQVLLEKILDHPLYQYKEYTDEKGRLKYIRLEGEKGSLLLRTQYSKSIKAIRIDYGENNVYRMISQIQLDLEQEY